MTLKSGLAASIGWGDEVTWGVPVTPTVWVPFLEESLGLEIERLNSEAIISGARVNRSSQWAEGAITASGDISLELNDLSKGLLLKHMFGGSSTTGPFSPADISGLGLTIQVGVPDVTNGTVRPKTLTGGKIASWELGLTAGEIATLGLSVVGRTIVQHFTVADGVTTSGNNTVTTATGGLSQNHVGWPVSSGTAAIPANSYIGTVVDANTFTLSSSALTNTSVNATASTTGNTLTFGIALTSPSYASGITPMSYVGGTVTVAGSTFKARSVTLSGNNGLADDRRFIGSRGLDEPLEAGLREYTGTIETEYWDNTAYNRFLAGSETALVLTIAKGTKSISITGNARYDGTTPMVSGPGVVGNTLPFTLLGSTTDASAITLTLDET